MRENVAAALHASATGELSFRFSAPCSENDEKLALEDGSLLEEDIVEVIMGITYLDKKVLNKPPDRFWSRIENYCGDYKYTIAAYSTDRENNEVKEVDNLICPLAAGVGNYDLDR